MLPQAARFIGRKQNRPALQRSEAPAGSKPPLQGFILLFLSAAAEFFLDLLDFPLAELAIL
jgi:hypothetical protein